MGWDLLFFLSLYIVDSNLGRVKPKTLNLVPGISCFNKHPALRRKRKDWLTRNQDNVSEWSDMFTHELLFNELAVDYKNPTKFVGLL
jgi:hypothetical protein